MNISRRGILDIVVCSVLFVVGYLTYAANSRQFLELRDEGYVLELSDRLNEGQIPFRDTTTIYGPGVFFVTAAALRAGDDQVMAVHHLLAATRALAVVLAYLIAGHLLPLPFCLVTAALSLVYWSRLSWNLNAPYAAIYTIPLCLLSCLLLLEALRRRALHWYFLTGLVAGGAVLFKQSLGLANLFLLVVAIWASEILSARPVIHSRVHLVFVTIGLAIVFGAVSVAMVLPYLHWRDYLFHLAPMHALLALVAVSRLARGAAPSLQELVGRAWIPFGIGAVILPSIVAAAYARWGALGKLLHGMFVLPGDLQNYAVAVQPPPAGVAWSAGAVAAACTAGMYLATERRRSATMAIVAAGAALLMAKVAFGPPGFATWNGYWWARILDVFGGVHLFVLGALAVVLAVPSIFRRQDDADHVGLTAPLVVLILLQQVFVFQIFPRQAFNVFLIQGAIAPLAGYVLWRWHRAVFATVGSPFRRLAGYMFVLVLPVWAAGHIVVSACNSLWATAGFVPVPLERTRGIAVGAEESRAWHIPDFIELVRYLQTHTTRETRLLLLSNEDMILFASGRRHVLPEGSHHLFLAGWGMPRTEQNRRRDGAAIVDRLDRHPGDLVVIERPNEASANIRKFFPEVAAYVDSRFEVSEIVGGYHILRRRSPDGVKGLSGANRVG